MRKLKLKALSLAFVFLMVSSIFSLSMNGMVNAQPITKDYTIAETYEWETFNKNMNVTTFVSPDGSKDELWHFLNSAEESIYVEIYGINHPYILDLIHEIHDTKPTLDMKFLIGWNSLGYPNENKYVANNLTLLGYDVKWTNDDDFTFAHQKFLIIDNKTTVVHSGNWAKTSFPDDGFKANREWSIAMTNVDVTSYYRSVFDGDWLNGTDYNAGTHGTGTPLTLPSTTSTYSNPFATAGEFSGPMNVTPIFSPDTSLQGILYCINAAQATLDIQIPYFTSVGDNGEVDEVIDAILAAKARGVTVRVITEEDKDFEEIATILTTNGIPIVWQDTRWFTANHNKGIIVDGRLVLISSINYSDGSISENREAGVIIENDDVASWYQDVYDFDWSIGDCDEMDEVNVYWNPNIPRHDSTINVTVYTHALFPNVEEVKLATQINSDLPVDHFIIANVYESAEGDLENYFYVLPAQPDMTNITVTASVRVGTTWHVGLPMVIRVRDSIGSVVTTDTPADPGAEFLAQFGLLIGIAAIAIICGGGGAVAYKKDMLPGGKKTKKKRKSKKS